MSIIDAMKKHKTTIILSVIIGILALAVIILSVLLVRGGRSSDADEPESGSELYGITEDTDGTELLTETGSEEDGDTAAGETDASLASEDLVHVEIRIDGTWQDGGENYASENIIIYNDTDEVITDWSLYLTFSTKPVLVELWNGRYTIDDNTIIITAESYNQEIPASGELGLGYNITTDEVEPISWAVYSGSVQIGSSDAQDETDSGSADGTAGSNSEVDTNPSTASGDTGSSNTGSGSAGSGSSGSGSSGSSNSGSGSTGSGSTGSGSTKSSGTSSSEDSPYAAHGKLTVTSSGIVDANGDDFQLKGVSTHGITWFPQYVNEDTFAYMKEGMGANAVRLAMYTDTGDSYGYCSGGDQEEIKALIDTGVSAATDLGMYVIIDWHILNDGNPNTYLDEAKEFFEEMSKKYAGYGNVIYEIANEPNSGTTWSQVKSYASKIISIIHKNAPDAVIIVGTPTWCQDIDVVAADPLTGVDNVIYSVHFYAATHKDDLRSKVKSAISSGLPVIISEFGMCDASGSGSIDYDSSDAWFELIEKYHLSYMCWNFSNKAETSSLISSSCTKVSGFSDSDLSASGKYLKEKMNS